MEERFLEQVLKKNIESIVRDRIDEEIKDEVEAFTRELEDRKDNYIAEIMKGIRIYHESDPMNFGINYRIIFENVVRLKE